MKNQNKQKGITLVALVITIIILLILAGISISALTNQGLFAKAQEAKQRTENAQKEESEILENYLAQMNAITFKNVDKTKTNPEAAMPKGAVVVEGDANKGIVIKDSKGNEWVWVEVPKTVFTTATKSDEYDKIKTDLITYATDYREGSEGQGLDWTDEWYAKDVDTLVTASTAGLTDAQKALNNGCGLTYNQYQEVYQKMLSSVYTNGGFWISRYEIGDSTATASNTTRTDSSGTTGTAVSKANQIPYNYVTCSQAQNLVNGMSTDSNKTSSLLFGIQWDLTCKFLQEKGKLTKAELKSGDNIGSTNWGNYKNSSLTLYRGKYIIAPWESTSVWTSYDKDTPNYVTGSQTSDNENYYQLLTTGASEQTNKMNIYDLAGNEWEWTLEKTSVTDYPCAFRGGHYNNGGSDVPASLRGGNVTTSSDNSLGFRSTLY